MLTLTSQELRELTGTRAGDRQRAWLRERGIPFRDEGRILVSRAAAERWLSGIEVAAPRGPRMELVR